MNRLVVILSAALVAAALMPGDALAISPGWEAYRQKQRQGIQPAAPAPAPAAASSEHTPLTVSPSGYSGVAPVPYVPPPTTAQRQRVEHNRSAAFIGVQAGSGWIYEDVDQRATAVNAGFRWRAGPIAQVGIEASEGRLASTRHNASFFPSARYTSLGATARFNFGRGNPWYGLVRSGMFTARTRDELGDRVNIDGGYASFGVGVDINRHFNINLLYTGFVYLDDYDGVLGYEDVNRADQLTLGLEARF
jgi:hypothetical protein